MTEPSSSSGEPARRGPHARRSSSSSSRRSAGSSHHVMSGKSTTTTTTRKDSRDSWVSDMASTTEEEDSAVTPTKTQLSRFSGGLRKTRSRLSLNNKDSPDSSTSSHRIGSFFSSILSTSNGSPTPRSPAAKRNVFDRAVTYLFDPEATNDNVNDDLWVMGKRYGNQDDLEPTQWPADFVRDFERTIACTYRTHFEPIPCSPNSNTVTNMLNSIGANFGRASSSQGLASDTGWGCMLRTGQSLLANALAHLHLGREWQTKDDKYIRLVSLFLDSPSPLCPFSIHRFALMGKQLGKEVGEWFGPSTAAGAIKALANEYAPAGLRVVNFVDGTMYESEIAEASRQWQLPVLVVMGLRLGINGVNPIYHRALLSLFELPQSVGIAGGRPSSSFYFIGAQGSSLFYIDPHHARPALPVPEAPQSIVDSARSVPLASSDADADLASFYRSAFGHEGAFDSYHVSRIRKTSIDSLDPSMLVGFLVRSHDDWLDFRERVGRSGIDVASPVAQQSTARKQGGIFAIQDRPPIWMTSPSSPTTSTSSSTGQGHARTRERTTSSAIDADRSVTPRLGDDDGGGGGADPTTSQTVEEGEDDFEDLGQELAAASLAPSPPPRPTSTSTAGAKDDFVDVGKGPSPDL